MPWPGSPRGLILTSYHWRPNSGGLPGVGRKRNDNNYESLDAKFGGLPGPPHDNTYA